MTADKKPPSCYDCIYRGDIPGDAHSRCRNLAAKVVGKRRGINGGWFNHPMNFDPVWLESCDGFKGKP